jgi:hypothetical protein
VRPTVRPPPLVQPSHDLVEQQWERAAVRSAIATEVEAAEHNPAADGQLGPFVDDERE